jgi:hypothetical protein
MSAATQMSIDDVLARTEELVGLPDTELARDAVAIANEGLAMGETILETWLQAHDQSPTDANVEGFRLLALHRQAARGNPSFNACRETCREIVYHRNLVASDPGAHDIAQTLRLAAMVVRHLALFVGGKLEVASLGDFCCSSRPVRQAELLNPQIEPA